MSDTLLASVDDQITRVTLDEVLGKRSRDDLAREIIRQDKYIETLKAQLVHSKKEIDEHEMEMNSLRSMFEAKINSLEKAFSSTQLR